MTQRSASKITISDPAELIDLIPFLLGFHPENSVCLLGLRGAEAASADPATLLGPRQLDLALRLDMPEPDMSAREMADLLAALTRNGVRAVVAAIFAPAKGPAGENRRARPQRVQADPVRVKSDTPLERHRWHWLRLMLKAALDELHVELLDTLLVTDAHWWSLQCDQPGCCSPDGHKRLPGTSSAAAEAVFAGLAPAQDRDEMLGVLDGESASTRSSLEPELAAAEDRVVAAVMKNGLRRLHRRDADAVLRAAARGEAGESAGLRNAGESAGPRNAATNRPPTLTRRQLARHAVALGELAVRDELWLAIDEQSIDASDYLLELLRRLPSPYDAPALFLFGWHQWRRGNGALAGHAAERALESDPQYSAAGLLMTAVQHGLNPHTTPPLRPPLAG